MDTCMAYAYTGLYIGLCSGIFLLAVLSAGEEIPAFARDPPGLKPLRRMAVFLYRQIRKRRQMRRRAGKDLFIPGEEGVRNDLSILYPSLKARRQEVCYQIFKIEKLLLLLFSGVLLAGGLHIHSFCAGILQEGETVERAAAGGPDRQLSVKALPATDPEGTASDTEREKEYGTYGITVHARQYTRAEADARAKEILRQFPEALLGENPAPDQIRTPLSMPSSADAKPFSLSWESSRYAVLDTDGSIFNNTYTQTQAEEVELTAVLEYGEYQFRKKMAFTVRAPVLSEEDRLHGEIGEALTAAERDSAEENLFRLPRTAAGRELRWSEQTEDVSARVLVLGAVAAVLLWYVMDYRLHERIRRRSRQMAIDYPQFISRIVLYMGAGMSVRNVFYKCAADYRKKREEKGTRRKKRRAGTGMRYLYEEILLVCNEMDSGVPEAEAYMRFGRRCHARQYTKLCSLLVQNLRRGNDTLLQVLQEEAQSSFEERKNLARELGEEAGTKLLLPMMIMLGITMLIIIVPAYFSFSM